MPQYLLSFGLIFSNEDTMPQTAAAPKHKLSQLTAALISEVIAKNTRHEGFINNALSIVTSEELADLEKYLSFCSSRGLSMPYLAQCYLTIVGDTLTEQIYFMKHRKYRNSSFKDVADAVYHNKEYMDRYMYGLAISDFFWPNHIAMTRFFKKCLPRGQKGKYLEIGPGHGYYIMTALETSSYDDFLGIDLSEASIGQTQAIIDYFSPEAKGRFTLKNMDFLEAKDLEPGSFSAIVMGEVLEHVEQPQVFINRIAELAAPDAFIYMTTCANAPAVDHIYLYTCPKDVEDQFAAGGLKIVDSAILPYEGQTLERCIKEGLAINVAYALKKA